MMQLIQLDLENADIQNKEKNTIRYVNDKLNISTLLSTCLNEENKII